MKRYLVIPDAYRIDEIEVFKENALSYWVEKENGLTYIKPRRHNRGGLLFDTWDQAKEKLLELAQNKVDNKRKSLELEKSYYGNVKGMKNPYLGAVDRIVEGS